MERLDFLSGKYKDGERIVPGAVQTFQAAEAASGRSVFVHRVPTTGAEAQNGVIRLLSTALLRSAAVRKLVVEVADENGFCYVITEGAEQCLLLREWLQFELDRAGGQQPEEKPAPSAAPSAPPAAPPVRETAARPAQPNPPPAEKAPGEFTRMFQVPQQPASPAPAAPPAAPPDSARAPGRSDTGEFTRFFRGGEAMPGKRPEPVRRPDRPSSSEGLRAQRNSGAVQRPSNAPVPPLPQRPSDPGEMKRVPPSGGFHRSSDTAEFNRSTSGEFARLFSAPENSNASLPAALPNTGLGSMPAPPNQEPGEYTRIFGKGNSAPPLPQSNAPASEASAKFDFLEGGSGGSAPPEALPRGPSEYTRIIGRSELRQAGALRPEAAVEGPPAGAGQAPPAAIPVMPQVKLPAAPAMPAAPPVAPQIPPPKLGALPAGSASGNKRLLVFLAIVALLAIAIVIAVVFLAKR